MLRICYLKRRKGKKKKDNNLTIISQLQRYWQQSGSDNDAKRSRVTHFGWNLYKSHATIKLLDFLEVIIWLLKWFYTLIVYYNVKVRNYLESESAWFLCGSYKFTYLWCIVHWTICEIHLRKQITESVRKIQHLKINIDFYKTKKCTIH